MATEPATVTTTAVPSGTVFPAESLMPLNVTLAVVFADSDSGGRQYRSRIAERHNSDGSLLCFASRRDNTCVRVCRHNLAASDCELAEVGVAWSCRAVTRRCARRRNRSARALDVTAAIARDCDVGRSGKSDQCAIGDGGNTIAVLQSADGDHRLVDIAVCR